MKRPRIYTNGVTTTPLGGMQMTSIGKKIRAARKEKKLRQEDLAERTGLSPNYIGMVERGEKVPSLESFISIANALDSSADVLLADVLNNGYAVKDSLLAEKIETLSPEDRSRIYAVVDTLIMHGTK